MCLVYVITRFYKASTKQTWIIKLISFKGNWLKEVTMLYKTGLFFISYKKHLNQRSKSISMPHNQPFQQKVLEQTNTMHNKTNCDHCNIHKI